MAQGVKGTGTTVKKRTSKGVALPKPGKMVKTSTELCLKCEYHSLIGGKYCVCYYIVMTGKIRDCEVGMCNKFKKFEHKRKPKLPDYR